jgi:thioredoxin-related protein
MTRLLLVLIVLAAVSAGYAFTNIKNTPALSSNEDNSAVNWLTWDQAIKQLEADKAAGKKGKKIFVDVYTDWCGWCKKMEKETFQQPKIAQYLNQHFYPVKLDAEQKADILFGGTTFKFIAQGNRGYHELAAALLDNKMSYPTVIFLNERVELMQRVPGYLDVPTFDCILHYLAEEHYLKTPWEQYQVAFKQTQK